MNPRVAKASHAWVGLQAHQSIISEGESNDDVTITARQEDAISSVNFDYAWPWHGEQVLKGFMMRVNTCSTRFQQNNNNILL